MIFLPHTNTVILLEPYCGTITEPGLPFITLGKVKSEQLTVKQENGDLENEDLENDNLENNDLENNDLENDDLENDDLENDDLENDDKEGVARRIK
ncbi:unnamed protein product, partial [Porites lobata]